jgi:hypothetical protein
VRALTSAQDLVSAVPGIPVSSAGPGQAECEIRGLAGRDSRERRANRPATPSRVPALMRLCAYAPEYACSPVEDVLRLHRHYIDTAVLRRALTQ